MQETEARPVTRVEVGESVRAAFTDGGANREELIAAARANGSRDEVIAVLEGLTRASYTEMRQIWEGLPSLPVSLG